jgi:hypothetical protein
MSNYKEVHMLVYLEVIGIMIVIAFGLVMGLIGCASVFAVLGLAKVWCRDAIFMITGRFKPSWR